MPTLKVLSTTAMKTTLERLTPLFDAQNGEFALDPIYAPSTQISSRVADGEHADLVIATDTGLMSLAAAGRIAGASIVDIARSEIGVAVPAGAQRPDLESVDGFRQSLLDARAIATSNPNGGGQSGIHVAAMFERLGIADMVRDKVRYGAGGPAGLIGLMLLRGEAEIGIQQMSELLAVPGIDVVGPLPTELQSVTTFSLGRPAGAQANVAADALVALLRSESGRNALRDSGLAPA